MYGIKRRSCVKNVMIQNELLNIRQVYKIELVYKFQKRTLPNPIQQLFQLNPLRDSGTYVCHDCNCNVTKALL